MDTDSNKVTADETTASSLVNTNAVAVPPVLQQQSILNFVHTNETSWQTVTKKRKMFESPEGDKTGTMSIVTKEKESNSKLQLKTRNRFQLLDEECEQSSNETTLASNKMGDAANLTNETGKKKVPTPPPIFVQGVNNFSMMVRKVSQYIGNEEFSTKALANMVVKIQVCSTDSYRKLVKEFRSNNIAFYTYQLKTERAFKVVIRHLHHSIHPNEIKTALDEEGYEVRNVMNIRHGRTKDPLPLFFVELEPNEKSRSIYQLKSLLHTKIQVESPKPRRVIVQCMRCQQYGHSKTYCTLPPVCVKCGEGHDNRECKKAPDADPTCGLCGGKHTANYKGCPVYQQLSRSPQKSKAAPRTTAQRISAPINDQRSYAEVTTNQTSYSNADQPHTHEVTTAQESREQPSTIMNSRLELMIEKMISQNAVILELLTKLLTKLI